MKKINIEHLKKTFPHPKNAIKVSILNDISFQVKQGEFITIFGPNGCGKSTLLKIISGVESFDDGIVQINSKNPKEAKTGLVFQDYDDSLMPWLNCLDNILFPLRLKKRKRINKIEDAISWVKNLLSEIKFELPLNNYPYQLSGGQQQLTAILRSLIYKPDVILMDEPFSSLDFQTRLSMQEILLEIWDREKQTIIFVSHDIDEAMFLADRLILLTSLPAEIYKIIEIKFPRPRLIELYESEKFFKIKKECLHSINQIIYES